MTLSTMPRPASDPWETVQVELMHVIDETPGVKTFEFRFVDAAVQDQYAWLPGQFNMLYAPGIGEAAISIAGASPTGLRHTIRAVGAVTNAIDVAPGNVFGLRGPFGTAWPTSSLKRSRAEPIEVVIVAGGIGLAPLRAMVQVLSAGLIDGDRIAVLVGARQPCDLLYSREYDRWRSAGLTVQTTVDRPDEDWKGNVGVVTLLLERLPLQSPERAVVLTCGPEVMMRYVAEAAIQRGIKKENVWVSLERNMNCAIGHCGHCQLGPEFLCKDGPVLRYDRVAHWLHVQGV